MANYYFDTSAFLKFYIEEVGSDAVQILLRDNENHTFIISDLTILEARSAIRRRAREGTVSEGRAAYIMEQIDDDIVYRLLTLGLTPAMMSEAKRLIDKHLLRTLDALQLTACLIAHNGAYPKTTLVCADIRLLEAATREGLDILNPLDTP